MVRIKTRPDPGLKITIKRSVDFQKNFDEFSAQLLQRREERDKLKAAEAKPDTKASGDSEQQEPAVASQEEETKEAPASAPAEPATEASQTEMTKA